MIKKFCLLLFIFSIGNAILFAQSDTILVNYLTFQKGIAIFGGLEPYSGVVIDTFNNIISHYYDGKKEGLEIRPYATINYHNGYITFFKLFASDSTEITSFSDPKTTQKITDIQIVIWFDNQKKDTLFFNANVNLKDSTSFQVGLLLLKNKKIAEFIPIPNLKMKKCLMSSFGNFLDVYRKLEFEENKIKNQFLLELPNFTFSQCFFDYKGHKLYLKNCGLIYKSKKER